MVARSIKKFLTSPNLVASALDWKKASGSVLSLTICKDKIDLAVASHPCFNDRIHQLSPITIETDIVGNEKILKPSVAAELSTIVRTYNVCGIVVSWPVQKEGWCGAPCGRVIRTLDQLAEQSTTLLNAGRPICLWDGEHNLSSEDQWGRTEIYSLTSDESVYQASKDQYQDHNTLILDVWKDFCQTHWPELYQHQNATSGLRHGNGTSFAIKSGRHKQPAYVDEDDDEIPEHHALA